MKKNKLICFFIGPIWIVSIIYLLISLTNIVPFGIEFIKGEYSAVSNVYPNYVNVFNSIFTVINILVTSSFSYLLYSTNREQKNNNYNKDIASKSTAVYYQLKFILLNSYSDILIKNKAIIHDGFYNSKVGKKKCSDILFDKMPEVYSEDLEQNIFSIIGFIRERDTRKNLFYLINDIKANKNISYVLKEEIIGEQSKLMQVEGEKLVQVFYDIFNDKYDFLDDSYHNLMLELQKLSEYKK